MTQDTNPQQSIDKMPTCEQPSPSSKIHHRISSFLLWLGLVLLGVGTWYFLMLFSNVNTVGSWKVLSDLSFCAVTMVIAIIWAIMSYHRFTSRRTAEVDRLASTVAREETSSEHMSGSKGEDLFVTTEKQMSLLTVKFLVCNIAVVLLACIAIEIIGFVISFILNSTDGSVVGKIDTVAVFIPSLFALALSLCVLSFLDNSHSK